MIFFEENRNKMSVKKVALTLEASLKEDTNQARLS